jgi:NADPH:quinone reductase
MRVLQITELSGPRSALSIADLPDPEAEHPLTPGAGVLIDVHAAGVAFPEVLQTRGEYQYKPDLPFVPGTDIAGVVRSAPDGSGLAEGDRVAACCMTGGFAEVAVAPAFLTFPLSDELDFAQGAALVMNYHTAYFALKLRGRLAEGETVLVHGADEVVRSDGSWKDEAKQLSGGGVDVVIDPVGGDRFTDSLRSLREGGRVVVVGFTGGSIPEVKVNRLLLNNTEVVGAGWGAFVMGKPNINEEIGAAVNALVDAGFVRPIVGARFPFDGAADALELIDGRGATGKVVLDVRD